MSVSPLLLNAGYDTTGKWHSPEHRGIHLLHKLTAVFHLMIATAIFTFCLICDYWRGSSPTITPPVDPFD